MANERYELNKELAQMLKGGVIMDVTTRSRQRLQRTLARLPSWRSNASRQISVRPAGSRA